MHARQKIYIDLEPHFIFDYIFFSAHLRFLQSQENTYKRYTMKQKAKAMCLINLFEIYQKSLEDLAVVILAFYRRYNQTKDCRYQREFSVKETPLIHTMINYCPGEARLNHILKKFSTNRDTINKLGVKNIADINITLLYPDIDLEKTYKFFLIAFKGLGDDQDKRLKMFNKIKHGGVIVGDGHFFAPNLARSPAAIYADEKAFSEKDHPLFFHSFKYTEEEFELMKASIMKISAIIKILFSGYLCREYPNFLRTKGFMSSLQIFKEIDAKKLLSLWNGY